MNQRISFPLNRKSVATGRNEGFICNIFSRHGKTTSGRNDIWEIGAKQISLARKSVSTSQNKGFVVKINLRYAEKNFNFQEYLKNGKSGFH